MKHINKRWLSLAIAPLLFALLGIASQAQATTYTSCSSVPVSVPGDADISDSGACVISHSVTANGGHISITAPSVTVQDLTADYDITVTTAGNITVAGGITTGFGQVNLQGDNVNISGAVNATYDVTVMATGDIDLHNVSSAYRVHLETADDKDVTATGNLQAVYSYVYLKGDNLKVTGTVKALTNGNILMLAQHNLATGSVTGAPGGNIDFKANRSGSSSLFTIGGSGHTNGINGTVEAKGSGSSQIYASAIVMFTNGAGGIAISSTSDLIVTPASGGKTPNIFIDARDGVLSIPSGTISVDGSGTGLAGAIALAGQTINFGSNVVLSANQDQSAAGNNHWISLYAETINYQGSLTVSANGSGYDQYTRAGASVRSKGTFTVDDGEDPYYLPIWWNGTYPTSGNVSVNGAGSAPLSMTANGDNTSVSVAGDVLSFAGGNVSLTAKGNIRHEVFIEKQATLVGTSTGLTFGGTGAVTLDASGLADGDAGGWVSIYVDNASISGSAFTIHADAKGNANAGEVWFNPYNLAQLSSTVVNLTADGKGGLVSFQPNGGSGTASITGTTFSMSASGPTSGDGDAGTLYFGVSSLTLGGSTKGTLKGNGPATGTGNGATVTYYPGTTHAKLGTNNGDFQFSADSGTSGGNGGVIRVNPYPGDLTIDTANAVHASALGTNGAGGKITLVANPDIHVNPTLTGAAINVDGKGTGDGGEIRIWANGTLELGTGAGALAVSADALGTGDGGTIEIGYATTLTVSSNLSASSKGSGSNGNGGHVSLHDISTLSFTGSGATIKADGAGTGDGGTIELTPFNGLTIGSGSGAVDLSAKGGGAGLGSITLDSHFSPLTIDGANITVDAGTNKEGGVISVEGSSVTINGNLTANGNGNGKGGSIKAIANSDTLSVTGNMSANGLGSGTAGKIELKGTTVNLSTGMFTANAGPSGTISPADTNIIITSTNNLNLAAGLILQSTGGASAASSKSGTIVVSSEGNITNSGLINVNNGASNGSAGFITLEAGSGSAPGYLSVSGAGSITANGVTGGNITLNYRDSGGTNPLRVFSGASIYADRPSSGTGVEGNITLRNTANDNTNAEIDGVVSALNGVFTVTVPPTGAVDVKLSGDGQIIGAVSVGGALNIEIDMAIGSITLDQVGVYDLTGQVKIDTTFGTGSDILSNGNGRIASAAVDLKSGGNIGSSSQALLTNADVLSAIANTSGSAKNVFIDNFNFSGDRLSLIGAASANFTLTTNLSLDVTSAVAGFDSSLNRYIGNMSLTSTGGAEITIAEDGGVSSGGGSVTIQGTDATNLNVGENASISALGLSTSPGLVLLQMGSPLGLINFPGLTYFHLTGGSLVPQVGPLVFTANSPDSTATVVNSSMVIYGVYGSNITFEGGNTVTAFSP